MLRTATNGLHGSPHVTIGRKQIPASGQKFIAFNSAANVEQFGLAISAILEHTRPGHVAIAFNHGVRSAQFSRFFRIQRGMDAAKDHVSATVARNFAEFIAAQSVAGVDADAYNITRSDAQRISGGKRFIHKNWGAINKWGGRCQYVEPSRCNDRRAKRDVARIDQMDFHSAMGHSLGILQNRFRQTFRSWPGPLLQDRSLPNGALQLDRLRILWVRKFPRDEAG